MTFYLYYYHGWNHSRLCNNTLYYGTWKVRLWSIKNKREQQLIECLKSQQRIIIMIMFFHVCPFFAPVFTLFLQRISTSLYPGMFLELRRYEVWETRDEDQIINEKISKTTSKPFASGKAGRGGKEIPPFTNNMYVPKIRHQLVKRRKLKNIFIYVSNPLQRGGRRVFILSSTHTCVKEMGAASERGYNCSIRRTTMKSQSLFLFQSQSTLFCPGSFVSRRYERTYEWRSSISGVDSARRKADVATRLTDDNVRDDQMGQNACGLGGIDDVLLLLLSISRSSPNSRGWTLLFTFWVQLLSRRMMNQLVIAVYDYRVHRPVDVE